MIDDAVERPLLDEHLDDGYLHPGYEGYCFANVPDTVLSVLDRPADRPLPDRAFEGIGTDAEAVLVVLVDGFGLRQWRRERDRHDPLARVTDRSRVTPLTSIYPSETAAAITTFHTGRLPAEHGVIGWNVYEPTADVCFEALPFATREGERPPGLEPDDVFDAEALYPDLVDAGVACHHVVPFEGTYAGARAYPYDDLAGFPAALERAVADAEDPAYVFAYLPHVDHAAHEHGTGTEAYRETVGAVFDAIDRALTGAPVGSPAETLVVVTADHGHVDTDPRRNVDLTRIPVVERSLRRHADGAPVRFAGSPRNVHLHLKPGTVERVHERLSSLLDARVYRREEVLAAGLFGDRDPSPTFERRLGDLVVTHRDLSVWYGGDVESDELELIGMHGGLAPEEMLVPFAAATLDRLRG